MQPAAGTPAPGGGTRVPLSSLKAGEVRDGQVVGQLLYHGAAVDVGATLHGLVREGAGHLQAQGPHPSPPLLHPFPPLPP